MARKPTAGPKLVGPPEALTDQTREPGPADAKGKGWVVSFGAGLKSSQSERENFSRQKIFPLAVFFEPAGKVEADHLN